MMDWYDGGVGWTAWFATAAMMLVFWGLVIVAVVLVARSIGNDRGRTDPAAGPDAFAILDQGLARGEIDLEEYHRRREALDCQSHDHSGNL